MFAAMKTGSTFTPPPKPTIPTSNSGASNSRDDSRKVQLKVLGIPDGTDPVSLLFLNPLAARNKIVIFFQSKVIAN